MRFANVRPVTRGWTWPLAAKKRTEEPLTKTEASDPLLVELRKKTAHLVEADHGEAGNRWEDENKLANLSIAVWATASDAQKYMAPLNAFSRGWGKSYGRITKDETIDGLGDEAWRLWVTTDYGGREVTYHWRRGNLVVEAHIDCFGVCPGDVDAAARAWVDAIDEAARAGS